MITENDIKLEMDKLNTAASKFDKVYEYRKGTEGKWGLFEVHDDNVFRPVYMATTTAGFFAYINLLKNLFERGKVK